MPDPLPNSQTSTSLPYATVSAKRKIVRPAAVSVLAYLGIIIGSLLLFCDIIVMVTEALLLHTPDRSPLPGMPPLDPLVMKIGAANAAAGVVFGAILLGGSLAAVFLRPGARKVIIAWSVGFILWGIARTIGEIYYVGPANLQWTRLHRPKDPAYASGKMANGIVPNAIGALMLYCILPTLFLILWNRREVKSAFRRGQAEGNFVPK